MVNARPLVSLYQILRHYVILALIFFDPVICIIRYVIACKAVVV